MCFGNFYTKTQIIIVCSFIFLLGILQIEFIIGGMRSCKNKCTPIHMDQSVRIHGFGIFMHQAIGFVDLSGFFTVLCSLFICILPRKFILYTVCTTNYKNVLSCLCQFYYQLQQICVDVLLNLCVSLYNCFRQLCCMSVICVYNILAAEYQLLSL